MKKRKLTVFIIINVELMVLFVLLIFFAKELLTILGVPMVGALVTNGAIYIGGNVWHAWQKSKFFTPGLKEENDKLSD